jgi:hypothetical protein
VEKFFENEQVLALFLVFFVPGFLSLKVYDLLVPGERRDFSRAAFDAVAYSALNFGVLLPLYRAHAVRFVASILVVRIRLYDFGRVSDCLAVCALEVPSDPRGGKANRKSDASRVGLRLRYERTVLDHRSPQGPKAYRWPLFVQVIQLDAAQNRKTHRQLPACAC